MCMVRKFFTLSTFAAVINLYSDLFFVQWEDADLETDLQELILIHIGFLSIDGWKSLVIPGKRAEKFSAQFTYQNLAKWENISMYLVFLLG